MQLRWGPRRRSPRLIALGGGGGGGGPDLISALPDDLLLLVLARLACAAAAARTDVLSRRWRGLWARLRQVVFTDVAPRSIEAVLGRFPPAASLVQIRLHKQQQQQRRRVAVIPDTAGVNSLLRAAARLDPEELFFAVPSDPIQGSLLVDLPCFPRATCIVLLLFSTTRFLLPAVLQFPALQTLRLSSCTVDVHALISLCPLLRTLTIWGPDLLDEAGDLTLSSPSLHHLALNCRRRARRVHIITPALKDLRISFITGEASVSVMAPPTLHNVSWCCHFAGLPSTFGVWRLVQLRLQTPPPPERQGQLPSLLIYAYITSFTIHGEAHRFTQEVQRHMIANFSVLELHLNPNGHVFGALVFRLLGMSQAHTAMQRLKVILKRSAGKEECPLDCICEPLDWRSQTISLNALQVVEINHFQGEDCEIDFLNLVLKSAPVLKRIIVRLSHEVSSRDDDDDDDGYKRIYNIVAAYSSVVCYVYLSSGLMHGSQNCPST